jgi:hypothetical protein
MTKQEVIYYIKDNFEPILNDNYIGYVAFLLYDKLKTYEIDLDFNSIHVIIMNSNNICGVRYSYLGEDITINLLEIFPQIISCNRKEILNSILK